VSNTTTNNCYNAPLCVVCLSTADRFSGVPLVSLAGASLSTSSVSTQLVGSACSELTVVVFVPHNEENDPLRCNDDPVLMVAARESWLALDPA